MVFNLGDEEGDDQQVYEFNDNVIILVSSNQELLASSLINFVSLAVRRKGKQPNSDTRERYKKRFCGEANSAQHQADGWTCQRYAENVSVPAVPNCVCYWENAVAPSQHAHQNAEERNRRGTKVPRLPTAAILRQFAKASHDHPYGDEAI